MNEWMKNVTFVPLLLYSVPRFVLVVVAGRRSQHVFQENLSFRSWWGTGFLKAYGIEFFQGHPFLHVLTLIHFHTATRRCCMYSLYNVTNYYLVSCSLCYCDVNHAYTTAWANFMQKSVLCHVHQTWNKWILLNYPVDRLRNCSVWVAADGSSSSQSKALTRLEFLITKGISSNISWKLMGAFDRLEQRIGIQW